MNKITKLSNLRFQPWALMNEPIFQLLTATDPP